MSGETRPSRLIRISGTPSARQREFFASRAKYTAYGGARGGGKSWALRRKIVGLCLNYRGIKCLLIRRTLGELRSNHLEPLLSEYGEILSYSDTDKTLTFCNGSRIILGYCASDRDLLRYQGQEYDVIAIDEATQLTEHRFSVLRACLRGVNAFPKRIYLTCNPGGVGHAWVKRLFIDRDFRVGEDPSDYAFIPARVYDNEALMRADPSYAEQLGSLPSRLRDAWLHGKWDVFEGQFFESFNENDHIIRKSLIPRQAKYFVSFDYGLDMLAALLFAVDCEGRLYVVREMCEPSLTLGEAARAVASLCEGVRVEYAVASPDLWNRRQDSGRSGYEIMQRVSGMPPMIPADDRRIPGWRVLKEYLALREGKPSLMICEDCTYLVHSMQCLLCDPSRAEDAAGEPHSVTHAPEALRYGVMSRSEHLGTHLSGEDDIPFAFFGKEREKRGTLRGYLDI